MECTFYIKERIGVTLLHTNDSETTKIKYPVCPKWTCEWNFIKARQDPSSTAQDWIYWETKSIEKQSASFSFLKVSDEYVLNDLAQVIPCDPSGAEGIISFM